MNTPQDRFSGNVLHIAFVFILCALITGCGGGGGSANGSPTTAAATELTVQPGSSHTMAANSQVLVPSGTTVTSPNGNVVTINGSSNTIYTVVGSIVSVPASATGPANNTVSTVQAAGAIATDPAQVTLLAGSASTNANPADGTGSAAVLWGGGHLVVDSSNNLIVSDRGLLRRITQSGVVTTLTTSAQGDFEGIAIDAGGNVFGSTGTVHVSSGAAYWTASIHELSAGGTSRNIAPDWESSSDPSTGMGGVAVAPNGDIYYADQINNRIVKFTRSGSFSVFAGSGASGAIDGSGTAASFNAPQDIALDSNGNLYVADAANHAIRKISSSGAVVTLATFDAGTCGCSSIAVDAKGNVFVPGASAGVVLRRDASGSMTALRIPGLSDPVTALVTDPAGNLYVGTRGNGAQVFKLTF
ncbi:MAG: hypothetical protein HGA47_10365 [Zoogloea sp.]|nr:hypothetical protein [Zoogloea sp.]